MEDKNKAMEPIAEPVPVEVLKAELTPDKKSSHGTTPPTS